LCKSVIESFHKYDYVSCKCGEISITGGNDAYECSAKDFNNFLRVDDMDNEISVKVEGEDKPNKEETPSITTREDLLSMLNAMISDIDRLPNHAKTSPVTLLDHQSLLILLSALFKN